MEQLRNEKNNDFYRRLSRWIHVGWWEANFNAQTLTCSENLSEALGVDDRNGTMTFKEFFAKVHPDDRERLEREFEVLRDSEAYDTEYAILTKYGYLWGHARCAIREVQEDGNIIIVGTWQSMDAPKSKALKSAKNKIKSLLSHHLTVSTTLSGFMKTKDINATIEKALCDIMDYFQAGRAYFVHYDMKDNAIADASEATGEEEASFMAYYHYFENLDSWWINTLKSGGRIVLNTLGDLPEEAKELRRRMESGEMKSHLAIPIMTNGDFLDIIGIDITDKPCIWAEEDIQWLTSIGNIIMILKELNELRGEEERKQSLLKHLFDSVPIGIEIYNRDHILVDANQKMTQLFSTEGMEHFMGINMFAEPNITPALREQILNEPLVEVQMDYNLKKTRSYDSMDNSATMNLIVTYCKLFNRKGDSFGHIVTYFDNTAATSSKRQIDHFNEIFKLVTNYAKVGYAKLNIMTGERNAIDQWYKNLGLDINNIPSDTMNCYMFVHEDDLYEVKHFVEQARRGKEMHFKKVLRVSDFSQPNGWRYIECNIILNKFAPEKKLIELTSINYDVTDIVNNGIPEQQFPDSPLGSKDFDESFY